MFDLEYFNGIEWICISSWHNADLAWSSLGLDNYGYRVIDSNGNIVHENEY